METVNISPFLLQAYVHTWWPNGYGSQDLYPIKVLYTSKDGSETNAKHQRIGFKTVELIQEDLCKYE